MPAVRSAISGRLGFPRLAAALRAARTHPDIKFAADIWAIIKQYKWYSVAILGVTVAQEVSALWPVAALGQFIDRLQGGDVTNSLLLLIGTTALAPGVARANVILRHRLFYETDFRSRVEMTLRVPSAAEDVGDAAEMNSRIANAVGSITNAAFLNAAACLDAVVSYSRAWHVYEEARGP